LEAGAVHSAAADGRLAAAEDGGKGEIQLC
jgi:hypothetical protein